MTYRTNYLLILIISIYLIGNFTSCKQKAAASTDSTPSHIEESYQQDDDTPYDGKKIEKRSVIRFSENQNSPELWNHNFRVEQGGFNKISELANGNLLFVGEEGDSNYKYTPLVLVLNNEGKQLIKQEIETERNSKYYLSEPSVIADENGGFSLYLMKEMDHLYKAVYEDADEVKMRNRLKTRQIDRFTFHSDYTGYLIKKMPLTELLLETLLKKGFIDISSFSIKNISKKIFLTGTVRRANEYEIPFIAILNNDLVLLHMNEFADYADTNINNISLDKDNNYYVEGDKSDAADGTYYSTHIRFTLNSNLEKIADNSDKEPYYSFYRGPSAPDYSDEEVDSVNNNENEEEPEDSIEDTNSQGKVAEEWNSHIMYKDNLQDCSYIIKEKDMNSNEAVFKKLSNKDNTTLWHIRLDFQDNYEVPYLNSSNGFVRPNGDFVFFLYVRNKTLENNPLSIIVFVFDKEGNLTRQIQTPATFGLTGFNMLESGNKLIMGFTSYDARYTAEGWKYPYTLCTMAYPL